MDPTYGISLPERLWRNLGEKDLIPGDQMRAVFNSAISKTSGSGHRRDITGSHDEIIAILLQLQFLIEKARRRELSVRDLGVSLQDLDRFANRRPKIVQD